MPGFSRICDQEWLTHPLKYLKAKQRRRFKDGGGVAIIEETK